MAEIQPKFDTAKSNEASDIPQTGWVARLPNALQPYAQLARLDRPIGTWLLFLPCVWGLGLAIVAYPEATRIATYSIILFAVGALVMRGAGCTWNDITDQDFDKAVARTATRPIPSGKVSTKQALAFLVLQALIGLAILLLFNQFTWIVGISSLALVAAYPFMKRITYWPQAWLGLTFNWGIFVGWASIHQNISLDAVILYVAAISWTIGYDTIYAHQDKEDDALIGVKSTALRFGDKSKNWITLFYSVTHILIGYVALVHTANLWFWPFYILAGVQLASQIWRLKIDDPDQCLMLFKSNKNYGLLIALGFFISAWVNYYAVV